MMILILGAGDLASGVALRLLRAGLRPVMTELPQPLAVRRTVSFAEAIYAGETTIEGVTGRRVTDPADTLRILNILSKGLIPVLIDPEATAVRGLRPSVVVDARMRKTRAELVGAPGMLILGLGPGFEAGVNCTAAIETQRGHTLGRVYWQGAPLADTGLPDAVQERRAERVLRAPQTGVVEALAEIGDILEMGQPAAKVGESTVVAPFRGILRGLIHPGIEAAQGMKIGDLDPRAESDLCRLVSDKSLALGGAVLEAILTRPHYRKHLWD
jgi:xanthine dehydrogenase accessory factor